MPPIELDSQNVTLGEVLAETLSAFERHMAAHEEEPRPLDQVARDLVLARALLVLARRDLRQIEALDHFAGGGLEEWMSALPLDLVEHKMNADALSLAEEIQEVFAGTFEATATLAAAVLVQSGRGADARLVLDAELALNPDDPATLDDAADLFEDLGEVERARSLWERLVVLGVAPYAKDAQAHLERTRPPPVTVAAKPGRNDPCSCGSGKKYKKCCG